MIKALYLIFAPNAAWSKIAAAQRGPLFVFLLNPLPLMLLGSFAEGCGLFNLGLVRGSYTGAEATPVELGLVERYEAARLAMDLIVLFFGAKFLQSLAESFNMRIPFAPMFAVVAYSLGPSFLARALDGIPALNTWVCWAVGMALTLHLFYYGVALVLRPDQSKGFGLFVVCAVGLVFMSGVAHTIAVAVLKEKLLTWLKLPPLF
jgi:hypothetical protein